MPFNFHTNDIIKFKNVQKNVSAIGIVLSDSLGTTRLHFVCSSGDAINFAQVVSEADLDYYRVNVVKVVEPKKLVIHDMTGFSPRSGSFWRGNISFFENKHNKMNRPNTCIDITKIENLPEYIMSLWDSGWFVQMDGSSSFKDFCTSSSIFQINGNDE